MMRGKETNEDKEDVATMPLMVELVGEVISKERIRILVINRNLSRMLFRVGT